MDDIALMKAGSTALAEKNQRLQMLVTELRYDLQKAREASITSMLGHLRLREAVLLYVGTDVDKFVSRLQCEFSQEVSAAVTSHLFVLDNAPVTMEQREALRVASNHGMDRW